MVNTTQPLTNPTKRSGPQKSAERIQSRATSLEISETKAFSFSGWSAMPVFGLLAWCIYTFTSSGMASVPRNSGGDGALAFLFSFGLGGLSSVVLMVLMRGLTVIQPGHAVVTTFFGRYTGTEREHGFHYMNPFASFTPISLRATNLMTPTLKVNDATGTPVDIGAAIAWEVEDTAKALFSVTDYTNYIVTQSETALRQVAGQHPYDSEDAEHSLRGNIQGVAHELIDAIEDAVAAAGLRVVDARIAHLAYAPEIASAMLRKQQAAQVVAARETIVDGAVSMVKTAIDRLTKEQVVDLKPEDRVRLVTNLMTVLVSDREATPTLALSGGQDAH